MFRAFKTVVFIIAAAWVMACNNRPVADRKPEVPADTARAVLLQPVMPGQDTALHAAVHGLYTAYLAIGNALAADVPQQAAKAAHNLAGLPALIPDTASDTSFRVFHTKRLNLVQQARVIAGADLKEQRRAFALMSEAMMELLQFFGSDKPVYQVICPMAFNDKGGSWLSDRAVIRNPYYGGDMLECGDVVAIIRP